MPTFWEIYECLFSLYRKLSRRLKQNLNNLVKNSSSQNNTKSSQDDYGLEMTAYHRYNSKSTFSRFNHKQVLLKVHTYKIVL